MEYLQRKEPYFSEDSSIQNNAKGVTAEGAEHADKAKEVGMKVIESMEGVSDTDYTFKKASRIVTTDIKLRLKANGDSFPVDPPLSSAC